MITEERKRAAIVKHQAREFANLVKLENLAFKIPDSTVDALTDAEYAEFCRWLTVFGLYKRYDFRWERKQ